MEKHTPANNLELYTDGACSGNPGPGGWAALQRYSKEGEVHEKVLSGSEAHTTNNRMELMAVIGGLSDLTEGCVVAVFTDSKYVCDGMSKWIHGWKKKNWVSSTKEPVKNKDLWLLLDALSFKHVLSWHWVRGHNGHAENERVDILARLEVDKIKYSLKI